MSEKFWGIQDQIPEPKRSFRWVLESNLGPIWTVQIVKKPSWEVSNTPVKFINHTFNYPGRITWQPIDVTLVDPLTPDAAHTAMAIVGMSGYRYPTTVLDASHTLTKQNSVNSLGQISIKQIGLDLGEVVEEWRLKNAWVSNVDTGELSYDSEDMVQLKVTIQYDWAEHHALSGKASIYPPAAAEANGNPDRTDGLNKISKKVGQGKG
jgi:hypothetical protein